MITYEKLVEENAQLRGLLASNDTAKHEVVKENKKLRSALEEARKIILDIPTAVGVAGCNDARMRIKDWKLLSMRAIEWLETATGKEGSK